MAEVVDSLQTQADSGVRLLDAKRGMRESSRLAGVELQALNLIGWNFDAASNVWREDVALCLRADVRSVWMSGADKTES